MKKKIWSLFFWSGFTIVLGIVIWQCDKHDIGLGEALAGAAIAFAIEKVISAIQNLLDDTNWKISQRKLMRGGIIDNSEIVRISFAYLFRINYGDNYLLVPNTRNTGKYQPVGGVYKFTDAEKKILKNRFHIMDDNKIPIDHSSRNDYRLRIENRYLRSFVRRFDKKGQRERIDNISREFKEELIDPGLLSWAQIKYRYCGRHITELKYSDHFQIYELLLADVVELIPSKQQLQELQLLMEQESTAYRFASASEIRSLGINTTTGNLVESISDHTKTIIQESEGQLVKASGVGREYTVKIL